MRKIFALSLALSMSFLCVPGSPATKPQVMLGMRVLKVTLPKKHSSGLDWEKMPFKPGLNKEIDFYRVLRELKSLGDVGVLFNQSLIGISGGKIEADTIVSGPPRPGEEGRIEVGARFTGDIEVAGNDAHLALDYEISYLYGHAPSRVAKTSFKSSVAIGSGQTLVLDDLIVEQGEEERSVEVLVFISAYVIK